MRKFVGYAIGITRYGTASAITWLYEPVEGCDHMEFGHSLAEAELFYQYPEGLVRHLHETSRVDSVNLLVVQPIFRQVKAKAGHQPAPDESDPAFRKALEEIADLQVEDPTHLKTFTTDTGLARALERYRIASIARSFLSRYNKKADS